MKATIAIVATIAVIVTVQLALDHRDPPLPELPQDPPSAGLTYTRQHREPSPTAPVSTTQATQLTAEQTEIIARFQARAAADRAEYLAIVKKPRDIFESMTTEEEAQCDNYGVQQRQLDAEFRAALGPDGVRQYEYEKRHAGQDRVVAELVSNLGISKEEATMSFKRGVEMARINRPNYPGTTNRGGRYLP